MRSLSKTVTVWTMVTVGALAGCANENDVEYVGDASPGGGGTGGGGAGGSSAGDASASDGFKLGGPDGPPVSTGCMPEGEKMYAAMENRDVATTEEFSAVMFNSNPPSSGPHCPTPGAYGSYSVEKPLPRCNYLENLARGGVVVVYKGGGTELLQQIGRAMVDVKDPDCPSSRVVITPDKDLDTTVAAVAWGFTWKSGCLDPAARAGLSDFINAHMGSKGQAPEKAPAVCK